MKSSDADDVNDNADANSIRTIGDNIRLIGKMLHLINDAISFVDNAHISSFCGCCVSVVVSNIVLIE